MEAPTHVGIEIQHRLSFHDHGERVRRAKTRRTLHGAHHDRAGVFNEVLPSGAGSHGVIDMAH